MTKKILIIIALMLSAPLGEWAVMRAQSTLIGDYPETDTLNVQRPRRTKAQGYRIQVYSGINGRKSKMEAQQKGELVHTLFPELSVYCHYKAPRWVCRVGDFPTIDVARRYYNAMRRSPLFNECQLVKSQVLLPIKEQDPDYTLP
ncbi:MAG: hypothetical protein MJZ54_02570 [Bacteroidaceae bacterium]|nr:hypothetical protein [Bacteroidaceae bacterium]